MNSYRIILLFSLLSVSLHAAGMRDTDTLSVPDRAEREFFGTQYRYVYGDNPSMLTWWEYPTYAEISLEGDYEDGKLHHPQTCDGLLTGRVYTESIVRFPDNKWVFSGSFVYENGQADSVRANLSYRLRNNGSPSFYFCKNPGTKWNIQKYGLTAAAARKFGTRWSAGASAVYTGDMSFRKNDVRNAQTTLNIDLRIAASCSLPSGHVFSLGASWLHAKEKPGFSTIYSSGPDFTIYLINGLGTYLSDLLNNMAWIENAPGAFAQWLQKNDRNEFSVAYDFCSGNDGWYQQGIQSAKRQQRWTDYRYMKHQVTFSESLFLGRSSLHLRGNAGMTTGSGKSWNNSSSVYIRNYNYNALTADVSLEWRPGMPVLESVMAGAGYLSENRQDKSYNYRFGHSAADAFLKVQTGFSIGRVYAGISAAGSYVTGLSVSHSPGAAANTGNIYTEYIGIPLSEWYDEDIAGFSAGIDVDIPAGKNNIIAVGAKYSRDMSLVSKRNFNTAQLSISIFF